MNHSGLQARFPDSLPLHHKSPPDFTVDTDMGLRNLHLPPRRSNFEFITAITLDITSLHDADGATGLLRCNEIREIKMIDWLDKLVAKVVCFLQLIGWELGLFACLFGGECICDE